MKRIILKMKLAVIGLILLGLGLLFISNSHAIVGEDSYEEQEGKISEDQDIRISGEPGEPITLEKESKKPEYAPGELVVKLKEGKILADLQGLNAKYNVTAAEKVLKDTSTAQATLDELKGKLAKLSTTGHERWYWQLDKDSLEYKDYIARIEKEKQELQKQIQAQEELIAHLEQRQKRAPEGLTSPNLENIYLLNTDKDTDIPSMAAEYKTHPSVEYAEPNYIAKVQMLPNDPYYSSSNSWGQGYDDLWGLKKLQCEQAWDISQGQGVVVAVVDTGIDYNHEDITQNIWINTGEIAGNGKDDDGNGYIDDVRGYDFAYDDNNPIDGHGHGTHCAGTIAAVGNNSLGVIGVAPLAKVMAVKGLDDSGYGYGDGLVNALKYAADMGADVISNSWGGQGSSSLIEDAVNYAHSKGCVVVAAAGNSNADVKDFFPASSTNVIAVAASDQNDAKCFFSNYGAKIDVAAPGGNGSDNPYNILSLLAANSDFSKNRSSYIVGSKYIRLAGTSMACPHVAGLAALILAKRLDLTNENVRQKIQFTADDIGQPGKDIYFGYGRVNAYKALAVDMYISSPVADSFIRGKIEIQGSVYMKEGFQRYELYYAAADNPKNTTLIKSSTTPVQDGLLGAWDTTICPDGKHILILKVVDINGKEFVGSTNVIIDNVSQPPVFTNLINKVAVLNRELKFKVKASDPDDPQTPWGQLTYSYSVSNLPSGAQFDTQTQIFTWSPTDSDKGTYEVSFAVQDNEHTITKKILISTVYIEEVSITFTPSDQIFPAIYGDKIVWEDYRHGKGAIYMYDLSKNQEIPVATGIGFNRGGPTSPPDIYQDKIVWEDYRNGQGAIYMYDLGSDKEVRISTKGNDPAIYADKIVWYDYRNHNVDWDIYMYDLSKNQGISISTESHNQRYPDIYADKIVWEDDRNGNWDIYMYDLSKNQEISITTESHNQRYPRIYGDKIVWEDDRNDWGDIYMYDLSKNQEIAISTEWGTQERPDIYADKIIWQGADDRNDGWLNIYMYDLSKDREIPITAEQHTRWYPAIYADKIVWEGYTDNVYGEDIYMAAKLLYAPLIISVNPLRVSPGQSLTISGWGFGSTQGDSQINFDNGTVCPVLSWSDNQITCKVPNGAQTGLLRVITLGGRSNGVQIVVDTTPPQGTIKINDDASYTQSTAVVLNLSATDAESGMGAGSQMQFSNDGTSYSTPEAYATTKNWTLSSGAGTKNVYVKFRDVAGNWSGAFSDTIILETPQKEEFTFKGDVSAGAEKKHTLNIKSPGAKDMYVKLTWGGWAADDLRLRIYDPQAKMIAEVDKSAYFNNVEEITLTDLQPGNWQVATKSDNWWGSISYTIEVKITYKTSSGPNNPPVANAGPDKSGAVGEGLIFDGSNSSDPDGSIVSYDWDFGDGSTGTGMTTTHSYSAPKTYTVTLTVKDNGGLTAKDTLTVTVSEAPQEEKFTFKGDVSAGAEKRHTVSVKSPGAKDMYVKLTWSGWAADDLRLRLYDPQGKMVAEVDKSSYYSFVEEITLTDLQPGNWQVAAKSDNWWGSISYTIEVSVNY